MPLACCKGFLCLLWGINWIWVRFSPLVHTLCLLFHFGSTAGLIRLASLDLCFGSQQFGWGSLLSWLGYGVCPSSALLWCRVGQLVMICGWFLMSAWYRDLPATGLCLGCAWVRISPLVHHFWLLFHFGSFAGMVCWWLAS